MAARVLAVRAQPPFWARDATHRWFTLRWRANWLGWALGGYAASAAGFNLVDLVSGAPSLSCDEASSTEAESLVGQLIDPGDGDFLALALGGFGPCVSGPLAEELLYRGFLLPGLHRVLRLP